MIKEIDYKNFFKVADLTVERIKLKNAESPKFCEIESIYQYHEKKMVDTHYKTRLRVRTVFERRRCLTGGTTMVDEIKSEKAQKNEEKRRNDVINLRLRLSLIFVRVHL